MAILYGTTADGDSLPVEVNEFGQLVAQGLQGAEGPPGPPGIGQLPPDPYEGALLGWQNNTLAWLGGSVPLPSGTFGPILSYENGTLTFGDRPSLSYGQAFYLSTSNGSGLIYTSKTSTITNVGTGPSGQLASQLCNPSRSKDVASAASIAAGTRWSTSGLRGWLSEQGETQLALPDFIQGLEFTVGLYSSSSADGAAAETGSFGSGDRYAASRWLSDFFPDEYAVICLVNDSRCQAGTITGQINVKNPNTDLLIFESSESLDLFSPGEAVQSGATVVSIDAANRSMVTVGGNWRGSDGSGSADGFTFVESGLKQGQGSVQSVVNNTIVLREDNGEWLTGEYITAPEQIIALRYAAGDDLKDKLQ